MHKDPEPVSRYRPDVPPQLERLIRRLLEKQVRNRYQTASELGADVQTLRQSLERPWAAAPGILSVLRKLALPLLLLVLVAVGAFVLHRYTTPAPLPPRTVYFTSFPGNEIAPAFSPDGSRMAFVWNGGSGDNYDVYVQLLGTGTPLRITSDGSNFSPAWSPDGRQIAFLRASGGQIGVYIAPSLGGPAHKVSDLDTPDFDLAGFLRGGNLSWSASAELLVLGDRDSPESELYCLFLVSLQDGTKRRLTSPSVQYSGYRGGDRDPAFSPDGRLVAFTRGGASSALDIYVVGVEGGEPRRLTFDNKEISGLCWSADGRSILFSSNRSGDSSLWRVPASGGPVELLSVSGPGATQPSASPRGNLLAYRQGVMDRNIWRVDLDGPSSSAKTLTPRQLIASTRRDSSPQISPDGSRIAFASDRTGDFEIWVCENDGQNPVQLTFGIHAAGSPRWSPDGRRIAFDSTGKGNRDIYVVEASGGQVLPITHDVSEDVRPSWSRDGRWIYFGSNRTGDWQVWKTPAGGGPALEVTRGGGREAFESPDGTYVYYAREASSLGIWRVPVEGGPEVEVLARGRQGYWALLENGIYFLDALEDGLAINFFSFPTAQTSQLATLENHAYTGSPGFAVLPDGRSFLYNQDDQHSGDILLVENFR